MFCCVCFFSRCVLFQLVNSIVSQIGVQVYSCLGWNVLLRNSIVIRNSSIGLMQLRILNSFIGSSWLEVIIVLKVSVLISFSIGSSSYRCGVLWKVWFLLFSQYSVVNVSGSRKSILKMNLDSVFMFILCCSMKYGGQFSVVIREIQENVWVSQNLWSILVSVQVMVIVCSGVRCLLQNICFISIIVSGRRKQFSDSLRVFLVNGVQMKMFYCSSIIVVVSGKQVSSQGLVNSWCQVVCRVGYWWVVMISRNIIGIDQII